MVVWLMNKYFTLKSYDAWILLIDNSTVIPINENTFRLIISFDQKVRIMTVLNSLIFHAKNENIKKHLQDLYLFLMGKRDVIIRREINAKDIV